MYGIDRHPIVVSGSARAWCEWHRIDFRFVFTFGCTRRAIFQEYADVRDWDFEAVYFRELYDLSKDPFQVSCLSVLFCRTTVSPRSSEEYEWGQSMVVLVLVMCVCAVSIVFL